MPSQYAEYVLILIESANMFLAEADESVEIHEKYERSTHTWLREMPTSLW